MFRRKQMNLINTRLDQKELFYDLKSKMVDAPRGWYVIFKENICLYVGQSKNLPSRLATHLKGKYSTADKILIYHSYDDSDADLLSTEKYLMNLFKPVENVLVDFSIQIKREDMCESTIIYTIDFAEEKNPKSTILEAITIGYSECIILDKNVGIIVTDEFPATLYEMPNTISYLSKLISEIIEHKNGK